MNAEQIVHAAMTQLGPLEAWMKWPQLRPRVSEP